MKKLWAKFWARFKRKPKIKALRDLDFGEPIRVATLAETKQEYVWQPGEPCMPGHELDGTEFKSWRH